MKPTRFLTGALLVVAFATAGCSKKSERPSHEAAAPAHAAPAKLVTSGSGAGSALHKGEEQTAPSATPVVPTFADGETAYHAKRYGDALTIFEAYTQRRPRNPWGHYMLALSAWKHGDLAKSEHAFVQALSIDPQHIKSYVNLSHVLIEQDRHDEAIARLAHAAEIDPESPQVLRLLGRTYRARGRTDEAVEVYRRAIELNPRDAWSLNNLALVFIETERSDEALPLLIRALELRKGVAEFHNNLGLALEGTGHLSAAAAAYGSALRVDPDYDQAKHNLARVEPQ